MTRTGRHADGLGLYLQVTKTGAKSWLFRYMIAGRSREMGLGPIHAVSLADAREKAAACRKQLADGIDPLEAKVRAIEAAARALAATLSFKQCAEKYIAAHEASWKNPKHKQQWHNTLKTYVNPIFGAKSVSHICTDDVLKVIEPLWPVKTETASRVRGRIEVILSWAAVRGMRPSENPARWRGHLDQLLPKRAKVSIVKHHSALPFRAVPALFASLENEKAIGARALEFTILTASRTNEAILARGEEIDLAQAVWCIPASRTKSGRPHRVPLVGRALELVARAKPEKFIFPGIREDEPMSNLTMLNLLQRLVSGKPTVHGFRSSFRDWAAEVTNFPNEICEMALAHVVSDKTEAAYRRGDLFERRRQLMVEWERFCASAKAIDLPKLKLVSSQ